MAEEGAKKKNKKINKFTPGELDVKIKEIKEKMGGVHSKYAEQLLARKNEISSEPGGRSSEEKQGRDRG